MISFKQALRIVHGAQIPSCCIELPLRKALGHRLFQAVRATESLPSFDNSAMDGWAVRYADLMEAGEKSPKGLTVQGEIAAGDCSRQRLEAGKTLRIFTGAPIPQGAQAVIAQEEVEESPGMAFFRRVPRTDENIRKAGEDVRCTDVLLQKNSKIGPGQIALLAALGIADVPVFAPPRVAHLATGSELVPFEQGIKSGQIRDSVSPLLEASLRLLGLPMHSAGIVQDDQAVLEDAIGKVLAFDIVLITGGVSVGKYDGVRTALAKAGVETLFWKVDMKPGKPIYFGRCKNTFVFGLPGNPLSALVGFEFFVKPLVERWMGETKVLRKRSQEISLRKTFAVHSPRKTHLVTVAIRGDKATALTPQGSHRIGQLASTNGLAILSGGKKNYEAGALVPVHTLEVARA